MSLFTPVQADASLPPRKAKTGDTATVHYIGHLKNGQTFDSSVGKQPLEFKIGSGMLIKAFEDATIGMKIGEEKTFTVPAKEAYGEFRKERVLKVPKSQFPTKNPVTAGQHLQVEIENQGQAIVKIVDVTEDTVIVDFNHPLAGQDLTFTIQLVDLKNR